MEKVVVLGSTGSIGQNTLRVLSHLSERFRVVGLAAKSRIDLLEEQAIRFSPEMIAVYDVEGARILQQRLPHIRVVSGVEGLCAVAALEGADILVSALTGTIGILPTLAAIDAGCKRVALANKEVLVSAGQLIREKVAEKGCELLPIDSEHSALFQCLNGKDPQFLRRLILTASGGPFWGCDPQDMERITPQQALAHPTWNMGPKVTIDCSTLMNKGLEVIEAHFLFNVPVDNIEVVIHPQSIIHSMVEWIDGSIIAQMSAPHMIIPIQYALTHPDRCPGLLPAFDFSQHARLEFHKPCMQRFPCLRLAFEALRCQGSAPCFLNAVNEVLVERFLQGKISWKEIVTKLETLFAKHRVQKEVTLESILEIDREARKEAMSA